MLILLQATTDLYGNCTLRHSGTSAAAPEAAGVFALALEAKYVSFKISNMGLREAWVLAAAAVCFLNYFHVTVKLSCGILIYDALE